MRVIKIKHVGWLVMLCCFSLFMAGCGATPIEEVDPTLTGTWQGECAIKVPIVFNPTQLPDDVVRQEITVPMALTLHADATVEGWVGDATIEESVLMTNRGDLGRSLNIASDYIILNGHLAGAIVAGQDETEIKAFSIPFDVVDGQIHGGLMWRESWKYPLPLCEVDLTRSPE